jgi:hypothetical protein
MQLGAGGFGKRLWAGRVQSPIIHSLRRESTAGGQVEIADDPRCSVWRWHVAAPFIPCVREPGNVNIRHRRATVPAFDIGRRLSIRG